MQPSLKRSNRNAFQAGHRLGKRFYDDHIVISNSAWSSDLTTRSASTGFGSGRLGGSSMGGVSPIQSSELPGLYASDSCTHLFLVDQIVHIMAG